SSIDPVNRKTETKKQSRENYMKTYERPASTSTTERSVPRATGLFRILFAVCISLCIGIGAKGGSFFDHNLPPSAFSDAIANHNDHLSWNQTSITYSFDSKFNALFPDSRMKDQVRLALADWATAGSVDYGANFGYQRTDSAVYGSFYDIRSITLHELG